MEQEKANMINNINDAKVTLLDLDIIVEKSDYINIKDVTVKIMEEEIEIFETHQALLDHLLIDEEYASTLRGHIQALLSVEIDPETLSNKMNFGEYVTEFHEQTITSGQIIKLTNGQFAYIEY